MAQPASGLFAPPPSRVARNPLSLQRVERALARSASLIGVLFFAQSIPPVLAQANDVNPAWFWVAIVAESGSLLAAVVTSLVGRGTRVSFAIFAGVYLVMLISWPFAVTTPTTDSPWIYYLMTVATGLAAIAFRLGLATVYLVAAPLIYAIIRLTPQGGAVPALRVALDSVYAFILGGAVLVISVMLRAAARNVDAAQAAALERYAHAVRQHALEAERVRVDAIVHDSVLTTLLSAARARTPEAMALSTQMASDAIAHLRDATLVGPETARNMTYAELASQVREAAAQQPVHFEVSAPQAGSRALPGLVGEAMRSAAVQAIVNSANHAGPTARRRVLISPSEGGIRVEVSDDGRGFDIASIPTERLGVRVSIIERLANVGGMAEIESEIGQGTTVRLSWPAAVQRPAPAFEDFDELRDEVAPEGREATP